MRPLTAFALAILASFSAAAWNRGQVTTFAVLPAGATGPEGIEVDSAGNVYVATFGFNANGPVAGPGQLYVFDDEGTLVRQVSVQGSTSHLLGLRFQPKTQKLLVIDFGGAKVLDVDPRTGASKVFMTVPAANVTLAGLNDITFDKKDNVYVSDSFEGVVWKTGKSGGQASKWVDSGLLRTTGVPPFGANGLRFNKKEDALFVANTGDDTVIKVAVLADGSAGKADVFTNSINGADGVILDDDDNLWVAANQADEIVVVDPTGKAIAKLGDFDGIAAGSPVHLLFPASLRFLDGDLVVTNLALDLRLFNASYASVDSEWCAQVSRYTIARVKVQRRE